jgi:hypothetical protein
MADSQRSAQNASCCLFLVLAAPASVLDHGLSWIEPFASDPTVKWFETLRNKMGGLWFFGRYNAHMYVLFS